MAALVALLVVWYYRRETRLIGWPDSWSLPLLRGAAVLLALLMLCGPVVRHQKMVGSVPRIDVFVDASGSMLVDDDDPGEVDRLQRAWRLLGGTDGTQGWLASARQTHHVFVHALVDDSARLLWDSLSDVGFPASASEAMVAASETRPAARRATNLSDPLQLRLLDGGGDGSGGQRDADGTGAGDGEASAPRRAAVLLSDGRHNSGSPPLRLAQRLGDAGIPLHTIGLGSDEEPLDVGVLGIDVPSVVAASGRASGQIMFKDLAGQGQPVRLSIRLGDETVWQRSLTSQHRPLRRIRFDFPVAPLVAELQDRDRGAVLRTRVTLPLKVVIDPIQGQYDSTNNELDFRIAANLRRRRLLIVDGRSRWETRYVHNLFDRDPTWQVDMVYIWPQLTGSQLRRYTRQGEFPQDAQAMGQYDVVIWGDCGADAFSSDELRRLREFANQGGAIVFIDGQRDGLRELSASLAGTLLPVKPASGPMVGGTGQLRPTSVGQTTAALRLGDEDSGEVWDELQAPTQVRRAEVLPGAEVWLEAVGSDAERPLPALVTRLFGGGQVVYLAFDQTWRWRYRVADRYHTKFWNQLMEAIMQPPFEVRDQYVALATGAPQYTLGQSATLRASLRDPQGHPVGDAIVEALLRDQSGQAQTVLLRSADTDRGIYEGQSPPLAEGSYEVSIRAAGYRWSDSVRSTILVVPPPDRESARLSRDESLLRALAQASGGVYADESEAARVWEAIRPLSDGRIETGRYPLGQSYPWFMAVLGLLAVEWWFRKRAGLM